MPTVNSVQFRELLAAHQPPCVSLYEHIERAYPANHQNPIRYRDLLRAAEDALRPSYLSREVQGLMAPFRALGDDPSFWTDRPGGLAVFGAADFFRAFDAPGDVRDRVVVADAFHVKPLLRVLQAADRFQTLCLTRHRARLFEGDRDAWHALEPKGVPRTIEDALGGGPPGSPSDHAQKGDDVKLDTERFFRAVDKAVWEYCSRPSGLPLVLVALPENQTIFRSVSENLHLLPDGVARNPDALSAEALRGAAWEAVEARRAGRIDRLCDDFRTALARGKATDDLRRAAEAAHAGRVGWALVDADRGVPGVSYAETGQVRAPEPDETADDDLLDAVGEAVLRTGGSVLALPGGRMPSTTGIAAVYRY